ncbi:UbiA family prenyltransferase [Latilactobacillus graminis]|uniref:UbiA prenyltransferase family protein n=2 Tax=Latilactobacillus graminis TaxID=60519 RepID=A0AA89L4X1_9LACO|nr:UbiA family prenyltransferase [Latilactobacillus graminis]KRM24561.1 ubiA prenyltransferase family protein [Latilactobacillus graminis DSM 20719]QFP78987.1 1,4-dihydroxy-2-naphthoate prenyltransferase [Latilactobacillus graminis]
MTFKTFLEFVRIEVKTASVLPLILGIVYCWYVYGQLNLLTTTVYFMAQFSIALFVTGFNNVMDYYKAVDLDYRAQTNIIGRRRLSPTKALHLILYFLGFSVLAGIWLVWQTNWLLLLIGGACIFIAIFYTFGPIPLSRMPVGELLSGVTESFGAFFIMVYVNVPSDRIMALHFRWPEVSLSGNLPTLLSLGLIGVIIALPTSNIMLADNICDLEQDRRNERYTLPHYLGLNWALWLYNLLIWVSLVAAVIAVMFHVLPNESLIVLLLIPVIRHNNRIFKTQQLKNKTFITAIQNAMVVNISLITSLLLAIVRTTWWS